MILPNACEYCEKNDVVLYAWNGDAWCASCACEYGATLEALRSAPRGRGEHATYDQPFIFQTPDGSVVRGVIQDEFWVLVGTFNHLINVLYPPRLMEVDEVMGLAVTFDEMIYFPIREEDMV